MRLFQWVLNRFQKLHINEVFFIYLFISGFLAWTFKELFTNLVFNRGFDSRSFIYQIILFMAYSVFFTSLIFGIYKLLCKILPIKIKDTVKGWGHQVKRENFRSPGGIVTYSPRMLWGAYFGIGSIEGLAILFYLANSDHFDYSLKSLYPMLILFSFWGLISFLCFFYQKFAIKLDRFLMCLSRKLFIVSFLWHLMFLIIASLIFMQNQTRIPFLELLLCFFWSIWAITKYLLLIRHQLELSDNKAILKIFERYLLLVIFLIVIIFWAYAKAVFIKKYTPTYTGELNALKNVNLLNMWTWVDYGKWYRYSPTGVISVGIFDRYILSPLLNIEFLSKSFSKATRFVYIYIPTFGLISILIYKLCRSLELDVVSSFISALFFGLHKGLSYSFRFMSITATTLMLIYGCFVIFFWIKYLKSGKKSLLIPYYLSFLLLMGSWEQWVNFLAFLILFSVVLLFLKRFNPRTILLNGIIIPIVLFAIYFGLRYPTMKTESSGITEAQYVFSYPSVSMMAEDMVSNASLHISDVIEPILFPWPMVSQSIIESENMLKLNQYDAKWADPLIVGAHYRNLTDWYAGLLFGFFIALTLLLLYYLYKSKGDSLILIIGLILTWTGFLAHLPIMYRVMFATPQFAGMMGYKHYFSTLGFSMIVGWLYMKISSKNKIKQMVPIFGFLLCDWIIFSNFSIIMISSNLLHDFLW